MRMNLCHVALVATVLSGCGHSPPAQSDTPEQAASAARVGHYSVADGSKTLVFDRSASPAKLQFDGGEITMLTSEEQSSGGQLQGWTFRDPQGVALVYVSVDDRVALVRDNERIPMQRSGPAQPLGEATVTGAYSRPTPASAELAASLQANSVVTRLSGFRSQDSGDLTKVAQAFAKTESKLLMRYVWSDEDRSRYRPAPRRFNGKRRVHTRAAKSKKNLGRDGKGLQKYGAEVNLELEYRQPTRLTIRESKEFSRVLATGTPGLLWEVDGRNAVFVTVDGGRYLVPIGAGAQRRNEGAPFANGPTGAQWPTTPTHTLMLTQDVMFLAQAGSVPMATADRLKASQAALRTCVNGLWDKAGKKVDAIARTKANRSEARGQAMTIVDKAMGTAKTQCGEHRDSFERELVAFIDKRVAQRQTLLDSLKNKR